MRKIAKDIKLNKDELIQQLLKEREIDHKIIGGFEENLEFSRKQIKEKDETIKEKEKQIQILKQKIERLNEKIETLYFNFPTEIEKQLKKLSNIPIEISKNLPNELGKRLQETQEIIYKEVLVERLTVEKSKLENKLKKELISILRKIPISETLILKLESENFTFIFNYIAKLFNEVIKIEEGLVSEITNLKDYLVSFLDKNWKKGS